jgi:hypothetical protein
MQSKKKIKKLNHMELSYDLNFYNIMYCMNNAFSSFALIFYQELSYMILILL